MRYFISIALILSCTLSLIQAQDVDISSKGGTVRIGDVDISIKKAPFTQGDWEISAMGSGGSTTSETSFSSGAYSSTGEVTYKYLFLTLSTGYYLIDGLSVEPELSIFASDMTAPGQSVLLNLSYTYPIAKTRIALFVHGGYGLGNAASIQVAPDFPVHASDEFNVGTLNAGIGAKFLVAQGAALKIEANYRRQNYSKESGSGPLAYTTEYTNSMIRGLIGISILL